MRVQDGRVIGPVPDDGSKPGSHEEHVHPPGGKEAQWVRAGRRDAGHRGKDSSKVAQSVSSRARRTQDSRLPIQCSLHHKLSTRDPNPNSFTALICLISRVPGVCWIDPALLRRPRFPAQNMQYQRLDTDTRPRRCLPGTGPPPPPGSGVGPTCCRPRCEGRRKGSVGKPVAGQK